MVRISLSIGRMTRCEEIDAVSAVWDGVDSE